MSDLTMSDANNALQSSLFGLFGAVKGVNSNFLRYDASLSSLMSQLSGMQEQLDNAPEISQDTMVYTIKPTYTILSGDNEYSLQDSKFYRSVIVEDTTFSLPAIEDENTLHEINLTIKLSGIYYLTFEDANGENVETMDVNAWDTGDVVNYVCRYEPFLSKWCIVPVQLN